MNVKTSLIIGISIIISVFLNNYYSDDRYSPYYVENEGFNNHFVTYVTDKMTGNDAEIIVEMVDEIPVLASGKRKPVICELTE